MYKIQNLKNRGVSLVEVVIATSIITLTIVALVTVYSLVAKYSLSNVRSFKAVGLAEEAAEVLAYLGRAGWNTNISALGNGTTYRLFWNGTDWTVSTVAPLLENRYDVTFVLSSVQRDASFNVVSSGGSVDTNSKKVAIGVAWREGAATTTRIIETYIFNTLGN